MYLKNSLAAGFAPILSVAVPAITALIDAIAQALAWIGQLVAALTGKSTFVKAKKTQEDYAKSLKKTGSAAKDAKKNIKRIDRERRDYFRYYTGKEWEFPENYDLMINTAAIRTDGAVETIKNYLKVRGFEI